MALRSVAAAIFVCILGALGGPAYVFSQPAQQSVPPAPPKFDSRADFRQRLQAIANLPADPCAAPNGSLESWRSGEDEWQLFQDATKIVTDGLNATPTRPQSSPADQATVLLKALQETSAGIDGHWPEDSRLHFQVLDLAPGLVVKMTLPVAKAMGYAQQREYGPVLSAPRRASHAGWCASFRLTSLPMSCASLASGGAGSASSSATIPPITLKSPSGPGAGL